MSDADKGIRSRFWGSRRPKKRQMDPLSISTVSCSWPHFQPEDVHWYGEDLLPLMSGW